ncbi:MULTISPECIES: glycosyltransferase family 2 protein [unclassified Roseburia]|nr:MULTISPECIES: glycosyltransferase family 2 protein [unclassified Roseburia]MBN2922148.1 glycosyltransferase family 2 protein [Lactobacillus sp.]RHQ37658.1 glycosyltransferase [Roseburia sp. AF25-25LB]RGG49869.1 glycosyltransferase [Roseburia sp. AF20-18LB]RGI46457.1 glycosyltransferase [Roseburia sp. OM04-10BH]RHQ42893.1 glycosyltransferase [Roseburia sp. AF25-18LB]
MQGISVVVPVFNEEGNVRELHKEILEACKKENYNFEIIFVDDGSKDKTPEICKELKPLKYIRMRKNFGQTAAMDAGIKAAQYDYIVTMDGDRQNDPADIPKLVNYLEENDLDIVSGWRKNRKDTVMKKFTSRVANFLRGIIVKDNIHDSGCSLKIYKKECFDHINLYGEMHRFIPALLRIKGFEVGEVVVNHRPRTAGVTKYNWKRTIKGFVDMISLWFWSKYAVRPLHILGAGGMVSIFLGVVCAIWSIVLFALGYKMSNNIMPPLLTVFFIIVGLLMFIFGLMSDMMSKTYYGSGIDKSYSIKETIENKETEE